jgi:hypothetical protein
VWRSLAARFVRDEEAAGSNPATPTMKLQVAVLFRDEFRLPIPAAFRFWERTEAGLVHPTSLTSSNAHLFVMRAGAAASGRRVWRLAAPAAAIVGISTT